MTYKKALELKKAGFPKESFRVIEPNKKYPNQRGTINAPTLEELIDECGDGYFILERSQLGWQAFKGLTKDINSGKPVKDKKTAVVNLYIALNKK